MITKIEVDGFKSLNDFKITFKKGLNVLIGPNGAGKSNICQAVGLLSSIAEGDITDFILSVGGIKSAFTLRNDIDKEVGGQEIKILCEGFCEAGWRKETFDLRYQYDLKLNYEDGIKINYEDVRIYRKVPPSNQYKLILIIKRVEGNKFKFVVRDKGLIGPTFVELLKGDNPEKTSRTKTQTMILDFSDSPSLLTSFGPLFYVCHVVKKDMSSSKVWNIDPHIAKRSSDVIEPSAMAADGRFLANAIHVMEEKRKEDFEELNILLKRIVPSLERLKPNVLKEELSRSFTATDINDIEFPANCLSDGTIKLAALLTGIFGHKSSTAIIEEPENYLHPWACQTLIEYFRDFFSDHICVITTHSETILNCVNPEEIVIVSNVEGKTKSKRISDEKDLMKAIRLSGFGCGYHYFAGSLGGVPE